VQALPLIVALVLAATIAQPVLRALGEGPLARANYRGRVLPCPSGILVLAAALGAAAPLALAQEIVPSGTTILRPELGWVATYTLGVALLGLADDALSGPARGWRGHGRDLLSGTFSTGVLKAVGSAGLALYVMATRGLDLPHFLVGAAVLVLATNALNLLDLRPGRAVKGLLLLGAGLCIGAAQLHPLWALGLFLGPVLVAGFYDVRESALLGDTGANLLGALAGAWVVLTLSLPGQLVALGALLLLNTYGEFRSISTFIERTPVLRELDSWGRPT
jgi:UDP-N-acetylmuramyl pentapeptide phosphotransferase/UDP-N-acetylglucosamine-1-phosphate transferase